MVKSLEKEVLSHLQQTKQDNSILSKAIATAVLVGISIAAAYLVHEFFCSSQYCQIQQDVHAYFYRGYNIR